MIGTWWHLALEGKEREEFYAIDYEVLRILRDEAADLLGVSGTPGDEDREPPEPAAGPRPPGIDSTAPTPDQ